MRALTIVAIVGLGLLSAKQATAADLRVGGPVIRSAVHVYEPVPVCNPFYGACIPYFGPIGYRFIGRTYAYLPDFPRCRTMLIRMPEGWMRRVRHCH